MSVVSLILLSIGLGDLGWWAWADARVRTDFQGPRKIRWYRSLLAIFVVSQLFFLTTILMGRFWPKTYNRFIPMPFMAGVYIWSILILPVCVLSLILSGAVSLVRRLIALLRPPKPAVPAGTTAITRRQVLTSAVVALPPLIVAATVARAIPQMLEFRIRRMQLRLPGLPKNLDGLRIAHVSDLHVGRYTRAAMLPNVIAAVNNLDADLILFTGDLVDYSLDDLPAGIATLKAMKSRFGLFMIEGNHDLFQDPDEFDDRTRGSGLTLLLDEAVTIPVRGERLQILGTRWGVATGDRREAGKVAFADSIKRVSKLRDPSAFPLLMAHHPDTFDPAAAARFPLTLSGHTHGGLFNLTPKIGFGPVFYRYWSGLYEKDDCQLIVSNGIGNWFPLRVNTPAEIIDITLRA